MKRNEDILLNDKPAIIIKAKFIWSGKYDQDLYDCEGDKIWLNRKKIKYNREEQTLLIEQDYYNYKFG